MFLLTSHRQEKDNSSRGQTSVRSQRSRLQTLVVPVNYEMFLRTLKTDRNKKGGENPASKEPKNELIRLGLALNQVT